MLEGCADGPTNRESPIFAKTYDLVRWLLTHTDKFPKSERFRMARRLEDGAYALYDCLLLAARRQDRRRWLLEADLALDRLRLLLRLSHDRSLTSTRQYAHASKRLAEIGRLLGGWLRGCTSCLSAADKQRTERDE